MRPVNSSSSTPVSVVRIRNCIRPICPYRISTGDGIDGSAGRLGPRFKSVFKTLLTHLTASRIVTCEQNACAVYRLVPPIQQKSSRLGHAGDLQSLHDGVVQRTALTSGVSVAGVGLQI